MKKSNTPETRAEKLSAEQRQILLDTVKRRFEKNPQRHPGVTWASVEKRLENSAKLWSLHEMERTGGEPDVISRDGKSGEIVFFDCSPQSPKERWSICYDREALESRKEHKPKNNAVDLAAEMGIEILSESEYLRLQETGDYDTKTSSWVKTPSEVRELGGAIFGDRRFGRVFIYHNGAQSYYSGRGFRGVLRV